MDPETPVDTPSPSIFRWTLGFILVGMAWGLTTPFIRKGAVNYRPTARPWVDDPVNSWLWRKILGIIFTVVDLLKSPTYSVPLVINLTGSIWFFLLIGQAELSLTVPIVNSLAFMFTVLGEWWAEGKIISRDTWIGMACVLGGIALCVQSKTS